MSQSESNGPAPEEALIVIGGSLLAVCGGAYAAWWFCKPEIVSAALAVQHWMMVPAHLVTDRFQLLDRQVLSLDPADPDIAFGDLIQLAHDVGAFWRAPASLFLLLLAFLCARRARGRFRRRLDLRGLMREQAGRFRTNAPFVTRTLGPVAPADGVPRPADPALHLREWLARFGCDTDGVFSETLSRAELGRQLGPAWTGYAQAAPHVRVVFAAFALHAARRRDDALDLLGDFAEALPGGKNEGPEGPSTPLTMPAWVAQRADAWMRDPKIAAPCVAIAGRHAYSHPALMSVLCHARARAGVLNPGLFAFVQFVDRRLFLALDSLGAPTPGQPWHRSASQAPFIEAAGAREHWSAELEAGRRLMLPSVGGTACAIRAAVADTLLAT